VAKSETYKLVCWSCWNTVEVGGLVDGAGNCPRCNAALVIDWYAEQRDYEARSADPGEGRERAR
jgi:hypothetical protein